MKFLLLIIKKKLGYCTISDLLILVLAFILGFYYSPVWRLSALLFYILFGCLLITCCISLYFKIYSWRKLDQSLSSFIFFSMNIIQLILYLFAISICLKMSYNNKTKAIFLDDLSILSQYRYLFLTLISIFFIIGFLIIRILKRPIMYPSYLKEEIYKILYSWNDSFMGDLCIKIIDLLTYSMWFRMYFFSMHFILFHVTRLISTSLLFYCTFFHGNFFILLYITPFMFFVWLLSFFNYYFICFQKNCTNYICSLISATILNKNKQSFWGGVIKTNPSNVSFELTKEALLKGYSNLDMYHLTKEWHIQAQISSYFQLYFNIIIYFNYFLLLLQIIIWCYITQFFFFPILKKYIFGVNFLLSPFWRPLGKAFIRPYATEARRVLPPYQKNLSALTENTHQGNHPALVDNAVKNPDNPNEILYEGQPTHGRGTPENPSMPLHPTKDLQGNGIPQFYVPPRSIMYAPEHFFDHKPLPGSENFLKDSQVKENIAKNAPHDENT